MHSYRVTAWPKDGGASAGPITKIVSVERPLEASDEGDIEVAGLTEITRRAQLPDGVYISIIVEQVLAS